MSLNLSIPSAPPACAVGAGFEHHCCVRPAPRRSFLTVGGGDGWGGRRRMGGLAGGGQGQEHLVDRSPHLHFLSSLSGSLSPSACHVALCSLRGEEAPQPGAQPTSPRTPPHQGPPQTGWSSAGECGCVRCVFTFAWPGRWTEMSREGCWHQLPRFKPQLCPHSSLTLQKAAPDPGPPSVKWGWSQLLFLVGSL